MKMNKVKILGATILVASVFASMGANASENTYSTNPYSKENIHSKMKEMRDASLVLNAEKNKEDNNQFQIKMVLLFGGILALTGLSVALINKQSKEMDKLDTDLSSLKKVKI